MAPRQPVSPSRRSWRESPPRADVVRKHHSKTPLRLFLAALVVGLLGAFAWLLTRPLKSEPPTYFVALLTGASDFLSVPPILFEQPTVAPLASSDPSRDTLVYVDASSAQHTGDVQAIEAALRSAPVQPDDRLVVYVSAHGVSDDGQAYVLAPSYDVRRPAEARYRAADLISAMARINASTKLLVLDCSRLATLPRLGMAANEFVYLVDEAARKTDDPNLWVMTAGGELETSPLGLSAGRSILGAAVVDGLLGDADSVENGGNGDRVLTLAELQAFAEQQCGQSPVAAPRPKLIYCGGDPSKQRLDERIVARLPQPRAAEDVAPEKAKEAAPAAPAPKTAAAGPAIGPLVTLVANQANEGKADDPAVPAAPTASAGPSDDSPPAPAPSAPAAEAALPAPATGAAPAEAAAATSTPPAAPAAAPPAAATPAAPAAPAAADQAAPIIQAWRLRDRLQALPDAGSTSPHPADYAPHLWSTLNATLVSLHLEQLNAGRPPGSSTPKADELIAQCQRGLAALAEQRASGGGGLITERLSAAWSAYSRSHQYQRLAALDETYVAALLDLRRYLERARQYVALHAGMLAAAADATPTLEAARLIRELLEELSQLDRALAALEDARLASWDEAEPQLRQIDARRRQVRELAARLDRAVATAVDSFTRQVNPASQRDLESFLSTELATADERQAILRALTAPPAGGRSSGRTSTGWAGLVEHLRLEILLVQLADPEMQHSPALAAALAAPSSWSVPDEKQRQLLRDAGKALREFYARIPSRAAEVQPSSRRSEMRVVERLVTIMHPRDAADLSVSDASTIAAVKPRIEPPAELALSPPSLTALSIDQWTPLAWTLHARHVGDAEVRVVVAGFDEDALQVRFPGEDQPLRPGDERLQRMNEPVALEVRARRAAAGGADARPLEVPLKVRIRSASHDRSLDSRAQVVLPRPNRIVLSARSVEPRRTQPDQGDQCLTLQPFPNRSTAFELALSNYSGVEKKLRVELLPVAPPAVAPGTNYAEWPPGRLLDESGSVAAPLAKWAAAGMKNATPLAVADITLPPDEQPHWLQLQSPAAPAPQPEKKDGAEAAPPPEAKPPESIDATYGLVCRVVNQERREEVWITWLEIVPLRPTSYLDFRGEVADRREIRLWASPSDSDGDGRPELPPGIAEKPVTLAARGDDTVFPSGSVVPATLGPTSREALVSIQPLEDVAGRPTVALEADGFPRAVMWRIDFDNRAAEQIRNPSSVRLERIGMADVDPTRSRLYRIPPVQSHPPIDPKQWPVVVDAAGKACAFDVTQGVRPLEVRLSADAPLDAFNTVGGGSSLTLTWEDAVQPPVRLFDDRQIRSAVMVTKEGALAIASTVDDFQVQLPPPGVNDKAVWLTARLSVQGAADHVDRLLVVFDGRPPAISATLEQQAIWEGTPQFGVALAVEDVSGPARIEAWTLEKPPRTEAELDPATAETPPVPAAALEPNVRAIRRLPLSLTAPAKEGRYTVILRVTDGSGQSATTLASPLTLAVVKPKPQVEGPVVADLRGRVQLGARAAPAGIKVTVKESPAHSATTDASGQFVISRLKAGTYTLQASGRVGSGKVIGEQEITLAERADYAGKVEVKAELQFAEPPKQ